MVRARDWNVTRMTPGDGSLARDAKYLWPAANLLTRQGSANNRRRQCKAGQAHLLVEFELDLKFLFDAVDKVDVV